MPTPPRRARTHRAADPGPDRPVLTPAELRRRLARLRSARTRELTARPSGTGEVGP